MLIRRATSLHGRVVDIRVGATIDDIGPHLQPVIGEDVLDADLGTVIPGLHDHHVHLRAAAAAAAGSVQVGPPHARARVDLARILATAPTDADGWIRAVGYHDSVAGPLDRGALDELSPAAPVRVQHRSGALWTLNSLALERINRADHPDGRFLRGFDSFAGSFALPERAPSLLDLSARWSAYGITGITEATPDQTCVDVETIAAEHLSGALRQRVHVMAPAGVDAVPGVSIGPAKRILDDTALDLDGLQRWIADTHAAGRAVAVHCVTVSQLVVTIAALRGAGAAPGDRIEHAAMVPDDCIPDLAELGVTVVTQPNFIAERGEQYLAEVPVDEHGDLWRVASLLKGGVRVALSTDTPFGDCDPWAAIRAAVRRETPTGVILGAEERISAITALMMFLGHPDEPTRRRNLAPGQVGDLCVLSVPPRDALAELDARMVAATVVGGELAYTSGCSVR